eukprot:162932_1
MAAITCRVVAERIQKEAVHIPKDKICFIKTIDRKQVKLTMWDNGEHIEIVRDTPIYNGFPSELRDFIDKCAKSQRKGSKIFILPKKSLHDTDSVMLHIRLPEIFGNSFGLQIFSQQSYINEFIKRISTSSLWFEIDRYHKVIAEAKDFIQKEKHLMDKHGIEMSHEVCDCFIELICIQHYLYGNKITMQTVKEWESNNANYKMVQKDKCNVCGIGKNERKLYACSNCRWLKYCSKKCQKLDWKNNHHSICAALKTQTMIYYSNWEFQTYGKYCK